MRAMVVLTDRSCPAPAQRVVDDLQQRGFYDAEVSAEAIEEPEGELLARFVIEPGRLFMLRDVRVEGALSLAPARLANLLESSKKRRFDASSGTLVDSVIERDVRNLRAFLIRARIRPSGGSSPGPEASAWRRRVGLRSRPGCQIQGFFTRLRRWRSPQCGGSRGRWAGVGRRSLPSRSRS